MYIKYTSRQDEFQFALFYKICTVCYKVRVRKSSDRDKYSSGKEEWRCASTWNDDGIKWRKITWKWCIIKIYRLLKLIWSCWYVVNMRCKKAGAFGFESFDGHGPIKLTEGDKSIAWNEEMHSTNIDSCITCIWLWFQSVQLSELFETPSINWEKKKKFLFRTFAST